MGDNGALLHLKTLGLSADPTGSAAPKRYPRLKPRFRTRLQLNIVADSGAGNGTEPVSGRPTLIPC